jgi:hypothetical protein
MDCRVRCLTGEKVMAEAAAVRRAIIAALPAEFSSFGQALDLKHLYVPPAHVKALRLDCHLVVGTRGVGKSVWTAALGDAHLRSALGQSVPELERTEVRIGFSVDSRIEHYPDAATFAQLLEAGFPAYDVWRAVVARWIASLLTRDIPRRSWPETLDWLGANPELFARLLQQASRRLADDGRFGLIVFDALDRTSNEWRTMDQIVRDLLRTTLWLKSYPRLSAKVFLREDQFDRTAVDFPDASKLLATRSELTWARHDLHGLLWQTLINGPEADGECLREVYCSALGTLPTQIGERWLMSNEVKRETPAQRALFEALAGPWMGRDRRRGVPYVWSAGHLADGRGRTSPRSFLAAIRQAAEDSLDRYPDHQLALHYESIKRGIQRASEIRVSELAEDYPWVRTYMSPLAGLTVPCEYALILQHWAEAFPGGPKDAHIEQLPPQHAEGGWDGVREDLNRLGLFEVKRDGRIDMPDLYRVGFGLGRRGGVRPRS